MSRITLIMIVLFAWPATSVRAWPHKRGQRANVQFLATSTVISSTWFWNEGTYLAELNSLRSNELLLARIADAYPSEAPPLSREVLRAESGAAPRSSMARFTAATT
jgi:hypothetical protein